MQNTLNQYLNEITLYRTKNTEQATINNSLKEKLDATIRDQKLKSDQVMEFENRVKTLLTEIDQLKFSLQDQQKDLTELKLKTDVLQSSNDTLTTEK